MHTSDANLPRSQQRSRTDLSFLNQAARAVAGATGLRPGTPTGDQPSTRVEELITRQEGIDMIRDKTGRLIPERHRALASRYGPPGIRIRDMTRQQLDDERSMFKSGGSARSALRSDPRT